MSKHVSDKEKKPNDKQTILDWVSCSQEPNNGFVAKSKLAIDHYKFVNFLVSLGYVRYMNNNDYFIVRSINQIVEVAREETIIDSVIDYLDNHYKDCIKTQKYEIKTDILKSKLYAGISTYFSDKLLNRCRSEHPLDFLEDTKNKAYLYFTNCVVEVTKDSIKSLDYSTNKRHIWKDRILPREFKELKIKDFIDSPFAKFTRNISGINDTTEGVKPDDQRFESLACLIGYNQHKYFERKLKATILTDSSLSDDPDGRTGKTLLVRAIGRMLNASKEAKTFVEINGKDHKQDDTKKYQETDLDTKLIHLNDINQKFRFEGLFNDISDGIKAVKHYKAPFLVNAKIIVSTNRTVKIPGDSGKDRAVEFQLSNYYSSKFSPEDEFKHWFFADWNKDQWLQFDNFMIYCLKLYLKLGLIDPNSINLDTRKLNEETSREFVIFMDEYLAKAQDQRHNKKDMFESFKNDFTDFQSYKWFTQRKFTAWCKLYAKYKAEYTKPVETRSNGKDFIEFIKANNEPPF